jgi:hypothetical protein
MWSIIKLGGCVGGLFFSSYFQLEKKKEEERKCSCLHQYYLRDVDCQDKLANFFLFLSKKKEKNNGRFFLVISRGREFI